MNGGSAPAGSPGWSMQLVEAPDEALRKAIAAPLLAFNERLAGPSGHRPLVIAVHDAAGQVAGGVWGATGHGWLYTQMLVVPDALRGQGLGRTLMQRAEAEALARGCHAAWVDTQFGARGFYERLGYVAFGELADYPPGFVRTFLRKALAAPA